MTSDPADRFMAAWRRLELLLAQRWRASEAGAPPDVGNLLRWAHDQDQLNDATESFLHSCRLVRNTYVHVAFDGYDGPAALPPVEVVDRLEKVVRSLRNVSTTARSLGQVAATCHPDTPLHEALVKMRARDYSQLPYLDPDRGWLLVTRDQVARWLEVLCERAGSAFVDLGVPVVSLADLKPVGPVVPAQVAPDAPLDVVIQALETTLSTPDDQPGGYATVLVVSDHADRAPRVLTADDLPGLYRMSVL